MRIKVKKEEKKPRIEFGDLPVGSFFTLQALNGKPDRYVRMKLAVDKYGVFTESGVIYELLGSNLIANSKIIKLRMIEPATFEIVE